MRSAMFGFSSSRDDWKLDVVSILAVLGESNIRIHAQPITLSKFCLLPRLIPAPQAFLRESRPKRLPYNEDVKVLNLTDQAPRDGLNYIPNMIHRPNNLPDYSATMVRMRVDDEKSTPTSLTSSPLNRLAIGSSLLSAGLLVWSGFLHDGVAFVAVLLMSLASSALGYASSWKLVLRMARKDLNPPNKIVLATAWGAFLVVECDRQVERELYGIAAECAYRMGNRAARALGGVIGGLLLTIAVVLFANCSWVMQLVIGVSFAFLNVAYWLVALFPDAQQWNLERYIAEDVYRSEKHNFTQALYQAIKLSRSKAWVQQGKVAPESPAWKEWIDMAYDAIDEDDWDCEGALKDCLKNYPYPP